VSIGRRIATLFRVKANKALDRAEDPREMLDYSYEQQLEMVQKVRRGLADVATSRKRVELQVIQLQLSAGALRTRPSRCRPGLARWTSCWPPAPCRTLPCPADAMTSSLSWMP